MLYFTAAPNDFRKILFVLKDTRARGGENLAQYYVRTYSHLIPERVEVWEFDPQEEKIVALTKANT